MMSDHDDLRSHELKRCHSALVTASPDDARIAMSGLTKLNLRAIGNGSRRNERGNGDQLRSPEKPAGLDLSGVPEKEEPRMPIASR